jgi:hypothetical protein
VIVIKKICVAFLLQRIPFYGSSELGCDFI